MPFFCHELGEDDSLQACTGKNLSHQAEDAIHDSIMIDLRSLHKCSSKAQEVKKTTKTQGNNIPQATAEVSSTGIRLRPAPNMTMTANKSETSHSTANNSVSIMMASKSPVPKLKLDFISIKTADGSLSGDEDQREHEEMLASPVKGSDAQTASMVSQITFFDRIFTMTSLPLCKALVKLKKTNDEKPRNCSKAELLQLKKKTSLYGTTP